MLDASLLRGLNGGRVLLQALTGDGERVGADNQQAIDAGESGRQGGGVVEIGLAGDDALGGETCQLLRAAGGGNDASGRNLVCLQQVMNDALAELARGAVTRRVLLMSLSLFYRRGLAEVLPLSKRLSTRIGIDFGL